MTVIQAVREVAKRNPNGTLINHSSICMLVSDMIIRSGERRKTECTIMREVRKSHMYKFVSPYHPENTTKVRKNDPNSPGYDGMYKIVHNGQ